ncbi:SDR family oxidoreductase [Williamsia sp.]|uniref:SDR family oxidoreductase n=1 Tax=Williamsia sp. TaxID=1872085 RepID=UPI002F91D0B1
MTAIDERVDWRRRTIVRAGTKLAVYEIGHRTADRPTVVLVHGWPDTHHLWTPVATELALRYHVVAYDTRGYGETDRPDGDAAYRLPELAADLYAVIDTVSPDLPVHVVAHDWGSVQTWEAVSEVGAERRIASFMSVSGPNMDHLSVWTRERLRRPTPKSLAQALSQGLSSAYTVVFQLPVIPKILLSTAVSPRGWQKFLTKFEGTDPANLALAPTFRADTISGLRYYRANIRERLRKPNPRSTKVPVFEIVNTRDLALRKAIYVNSHRYVDRLWRNDTPTGHWLPYTNPDYLADMAIQFIETIRGTGSSPVIDRARQDGRHRLLSGKLAVVTGAGSGIGCRAASLLADSGAEVIVTDVDLVSAERTAAAIVATGATAHAYQLDVTDSGAFAAFADDVTRRHGVADLVVNNPDVGQPTDNSLLAIIAGSRLFGQRMVERGVGGHIVNISSTGKAGVLMFTETLRSELAEHHIGVSAICSDVPDASSVTDQIQEQLQDVMDDLQRRSGYTPKWLEKWSGRGRFGRV